MKQDKKHKVVVSLLTASAVFFSGLMAHEGYRAKPYKDSANVPTIGIGSTVYPDGRKVTMQDRPVTRTEAINIAKAHVSKDEEKFRRSIPQVRLSQTEYDVYLDFYYNYGGGAWNNSSMRRNLLQGNYVMACKSLLKYRFVRVRGKQGIVAKLDCSKPENSRRCGGVWKRTQWRYQQCMSVNS